MRPTGNWRPAFADRETAFLEDFPLPRPDMFVRLFEFVRCFETTFESFRDHFYESVTLNSSFRRSLCTNAKVRLNRPTHRWLRAKKTRSCINGNDTRRVDQSLPSLAARVRRDARVCSAFFHRKSAKVEKKRWHWNPKFKKMYKRTTPTSKYFFEFERPPSIIAIT